MTKPVNARKSRKAPVEPVKVAKSEKAGFGSYGGRLRIVRESLGLSRPKFAYLLGEDFPVTTLKNYELGYRQMGIEVATCMGGSAALQPYVNYVLFGKTEIVEQVMPDTSNAYDPYAASLTDHSEEGLYGPLSGNDKRTQRINREIKEVAAYLVDEMKAQLSHFSGIQWQSPDTVPDVELGGEKGYWIAVKSIRNGIASEHTFLANYLNKPKLFNGDGEITDESADWLLSNDDSNEVEAVGWHDSKEHAEYSSWYEPITFNESYILLGWAEYNAPPFFVAGGV